MRGRGQLNCQLILAAVTAGIALQGAALAQHQHTTRRSRAAVCVRERRFDRRRAVRVSAARAQHGCRIFCWTALLAFAEFRNACRGGTGTCAAGRDRRSGRTGLAFQLWGPNRKCEQAVWLGASGPCRLRGRDRFRFSSGTS